MTTLTPSYDACPGAVSEFGQYRVGNAQGGIRDVLLLRRKRKPTHTQGGTDTQNKQQQILNNKKYFIN